MLTKKAVAWFEALPDADKDAFMAEVVGALHDGIDWQPNPDHTDGTPNPQRLALECKADELFFGGAAGGGKSDLLIGAAFTQHKKSVIFRRVYPNLKAIIERSIEIVGSDKDLNKSEKIWRTDGRIVELGSVQYEDNKKQWQGQPHDLYGFDEITEFTRSQYQFIIGWNRSSIPGQRCRVIVTGNPPTDEAGSWIIEDWGPWLDPNHLHKAAPGELKWYYYDGDHIKWLDTGEPVVIDGEMVRPKSRTFIPSRLEDNPHLLHDDHYVSVLMSMPEPLRSILRKGDFTAGLKSDPWQVIPTAWVRAAQRRWMEREKPNAPISGAGADIARGGIDALAISKRYGVWFDEVIKIPGVNVDDGAKAAGIIYSALESKPGYVNLDGIGVGSSVYDSLKVMMEGVKSIIASAGSEYEVKDKNNHTVLKMRNVRAEYHWRLREALDPEHGNDLALPPGNEILADLCAARWIPQAGGFVKIEEKDEIKKRIGRSPDVGEAIMLAWLEPIKPPVTTITTYHNYTNKRRRGYAG